MSDTMKKISPVKGDKTERKRNNRLTGVLALVLKVVCTTNNDIIVVLRTCPGYGKCDRFVMRIKEFLPYMYYRDEDSRITDEEVLFKRFKQRFGKTTIFRNNNIQHQQNQKVCYAKPLKGYQKKASPFLKIIFQSERKRSIINSFIKKEEICNLHESEITIKERFLADTDIIPGNKIRIDNINRLNNPIMYETLCKPGVFEIVDDNNSPKSYVVSNLWIFQKQRKGTYSENKDTPVAWKYDPDLLKQRFTKRIDVDDPIQLCVVNFYEEWSGKTFNLVFHDGSFRIVSNHNSSSKPPYRVIVCSSMNANVSEVNLIKNVIRYISRGSDFLVGYNIKDPFYNHSIIYLFKRLIALNCREIKIDENTPSMSIRQILKMNKFFLYTNVIDLNEYGKSQYRNNIFGNTVYTLITNKFSKIETTSIRRENYENVIEQAISNFQKTIDFINGEDALILKTLERSRLSGGVSPSIVWKKTIQSKMYRSKLLHTLSYMKRTYRHSNFIVCCTENMHNNIDVHLHDTTDPSEGGRIINPPHKFVDVPSFTLDFNGYYVYILTACNLGYSNMIFGNTQDIKEYKGLPLLSGEIGDTRVSFVQNVDPEENPVIFLLLELMKKRKELKEKLQQRPNSRFLKASDKSIKMMLVSVTGCLRARFNYIFKCAAIGSIMCYIGRKTFDYACKIVKQTFFDEKELSLSTERKTPIHFEVVSGNTDGFEIIVVHDDGSWAEVNETNIKLISEKMKLFLEEKIKNYSFGFDVVPTERRHFNFEPKFKVESIAQKTLIFHSNSKSSMLFNNNIENKANYVVDFRISNVEKGVFEELLRQTFENESISKDDVDNAIYKFSKALDNVFKNGIYRDIVRYERQTQKMSEKKLSQKKENGRNWRYKDVTSVIIRTLRVEQEEDRTLQIPGPGDHIGYIFSNLKDSGIQLIPFSKLMSNVERRYINEEKYKQQFKKAVNNLFDLVNYQ